MKINIYQKDYWIKKGFSEEESINLVEKLKKETSCWNKEFWIKKGFSEEESIEKIKEKQKNNALKRTRESYDNMLNPYQKEYWIKSGFSDEEEIIKKINEQKLKSNPYLSLSTDKLESMFNNRRKTYYSKTKEELKIINKKRGRTKLQLINKYGLFEANEMVKNRGCNKKFYRKYSKISESFFDKLQFLLKDDVLLYGKNEKWIRVIKNEGLFVDLTIEGTNKIIEFNGDFFHANPIKYKKDDIIKIAECEQYKAKEIWEKDRKRIEKLNNMNYVTLIIWENDVKNNTDLELKKCIDFIKNN